MFVSNYMYLNLILNLRFLMSYLFCIKVNRNPGKWACMAGAKYNHLYDNLDENLVNITLSGLIGKN